MENPFITDFTHQAPLISNSNGLSGCLRAEFTGICTIRQNSLMVCVCLLPCNGKSDA